MLHVIIKSKKLQNPVGWKASIASSAVITATIVHIHSAHVIPKNFFNVSFGLGL